MLSIESITFACSDPNRLAEFWAAALDGERVDLPVSTDDEKVALSGDGPDLLFRDAPKGTKRDLPIHLDLDAEDREATIDRLRELGASVRETKTEEFDEFSATWTVLEDPEGNGFCVTEY